MTVYGSEQRDIVVPAIKKYGLDFIEVGAFSRLVKARTYYNDLAKKIVIYLGNHKIKVTALNPYVMIDDKIYQMPISTEFDEDGIWVPVKYFFNLIKDISPVPISYQKDKSIILMVKEGTNVHSIITEEKINGYLIRIATFKHFQSSELAVRLIGGWLYLDIVGGIVDTTRLSLLGSNKLLRKMIPVQFSESAQLSFNLRKKIERNDVSISSSENEILLSIRTSEELPEDILVDLVSERQKWLIDKIIIDPGHGGKDPGTIGPGRLYEKNIVLDIAKRLKKLLVDKLGVEVLLTRDKDKFVDLRLRSSFANNNKGKLFISIHVNSFPHRRAYGMETYVLGTARTKEDKLLAEKENSVIKYGDSWAPYSDLSNENSILLAIARNSFEVESQNIAARVQSFVKKDLGTKNRGVKQGPFQVLVGTLMPKIYVEVGYITNNRDRSNLRKKSYRQKIAETIFKGIKEFKQNSESQIYGSMDSSLNR